MIGTIFHPKAVIIAIDFLKSLPLREFRSGLAEVIKYGVIWDPDLFEFLEKNMEAILARNTNEIEHLLTKSCEIKAQVIQLDEKEENIRAILNFGHTFGHAIETATHYTHYLHGEAVTIGMSCAAHTSHEMGWIDQDVVKRIDALCLKAGLPTLLPQIPIEKLVDLMQGDKKTIGGKISLILIHGIGKAEQVRDVKKEIIQNSLKAKLRKDS